MLSDLNQNYERQILIEIYLQLYLSTFLHVTTLKIYQTGCITGMKKKKIFDCQVFLMCDKIVSKSQHHECLGEF